MRILATGITGFAGGHLAEALLQQGGHELVGVCRHAQWPVSLRHLSTKIELRACDLAEPDSIQRTLAEVQPKQIYHLAGYARTGQSFHEVEAAWAGNLTATLNLYEGVSKWGGKPRILHVGSGMIYGQPDPPVAAYDENCPLAPANPYAASKAAADLAAYQYTCFPGLEIIRVRPFNHIGPRQSPQFAVAHFAEQIAAIEKGQRPPVLETGNLSPRRDFSDVRDMVQAYMLLMERGRAGQAYNAASGQVRSMQEVLELLLSLTSARIELRQQPKLMRAAEIGEIRGNADKLRRETGWAPHLSLQQTLKDTLNFWRSALSQLPASRI